MIQATWLQNVLRLTKALWQRSSIPTAFCGAGGQCRRLVRKTTWRIDQLECRALLAALVSLSASSSAFSESGGTAVVSATLSEPQDHDVFVNLNLAGTGVNNVGYRATTAAAPVTIDGNFSDWRNNPNVVFGTDPFNDTHDTDTTGAGNSPVYVNHPDVDLLEYGVTHDDNNLYFYFRSTGQIGRTQVADPATGKIAGRYYSIVTMDVDQNDATGYQLHEGGYYPTSNGYDMNSEIEYYGGQFNTGNYLNHGATDLATLNQAFADQSHGGYNPALASQDVQGPFAPGFVNVIPGTYDYYSEWVYKNNDPAFGGKDSVTFVKDKGPIVEGIIQQAISADGHEMEMIVPYKGFLKDAAGNPIVDVGKILDLSFSLEASSELAPGHQWASDTANPINGYSLTPSSAVSVNVIRIPAGQTSASLTLSGLSDTSFNPNRTAKIEIANVIGAAANGVQGVTLEIQNDDPPSITTTPSQLVYLAASPPVVIDAGLTSVDPADSLYSGASVFVSTGFVAGQDVLTFTNQNGITGQFDHDTGVLSLTGQATVATYLNALRTISYQNNNSTTETLSKVITFQVNGSGLSGSATRAVSVIPQDQAPQIASFDTPVLYGVSSPPVILDSDAVISDVDSINFDGGTLTIQILTNPQSNDRLEIQSQAPGGAGIRVSGTSILFGNVVIGSFSGGIGTSALVIALNPNANANTTQELLRKITYRNLSPTPSLLPRTVRVTLTDGDGATSQPSSKTIKLISSNQSPVIGYFDTDVSYTENAAAVLLDTNAKVTDVDSPNFDTGRLTIQLVSNSQSTDRLEVRNQGTGAGQIGISGTSVLYGGNVIGSVAGGSGSTALVVTLNGNATPVAVQALLRNVTYRSLSENPSTLARTVRASLTDGDGGATTWQPSKLIQVIARNDAPEIGSFDTTVSYTENAAAVLLDSNATVTDVDSLNFETGRLTLQLISHAESADRLEVRNQGIGAGQIGVSGTSVLYGGIAIGSMIGGTGSAALVVTLNGNATPAAVQALLRNVTYRSLSENPSILTRTVRVTLTDGDGGTSQQPTKLIQVIAKNDAPVIGSFDSLVNYKAQSAGVLLAPNSTVSDPDSADFETGKLTVSITGNPQSTDRLEIRNQGINAGQIGVSGANVTYGGLVIGSFTGGIGSTSLIITFNAAATPAKVQALMRNLTFKNTASTPSMLTRTVKVSLTDGDGGTSLPSSKEIHFIL